MHFIVIGTDHKPQELSSEDKGLSDLLKHALSKQHVVLVAEEVKTSEEVNTFGRQQVGECCWLSIDMNAYERVASGIDAIPREKGPGYDSVTRQDIVVDRYHTQIETIRENFWLDKIFLWLNDHNISDGTVIITCGHNHLEYLAKKIELRGHTVSKEEYLPYNKEERFGKFVICE
jgi:hypothetical protein